ncbi:MAG: hypothetical protein JJE39_14895 [Vicinamibacteria bacterium]|nr:hypothetical protein [Vicinamibacteria bacterium]
MEDAKIDAIAREVLTSLKKAHAHEAHSASTSAPTRSESMAVTLHPSLRLLSVTGGVVGSPCIIEPDKPCIGSLKCRTFGH